ncbi:MAG TPA: tautomerase family protein, partial [Stellaceae bacterium]|nr:tautomerase family protein [Stellaceae bacterium]
MSTHGELWLVSAAREEPEKNDRFQVVDEHEADDFLFDPDYLSIHRSDDLLMIQITWNEGRTV